MLDLEPERCERLERSRVVERHDHRILVGSRAERREVGDPGNLEALTGARLVSERPERHAGRPAQLLELSLSAHRGLDREKGFKITRTARIWIDASGVPLASEIRTDTEVRRLVFKVRFDSTEKNDYLVARRRLVTRRRETTNHWKAWIIAEGANRSVTTLEPLE